MKRYEEVSRMLEKLQADSKVKEMKCYIQHGSISTYDHCESVAMASYGINKRLSLNADLEVLLTGAMLHDFYLYDWHEEGDGSHHLHGFHHADKALRNAKQYFNIDNQTSEVIYSHMWPLNISRIPRSKEAWIVCAADKYVSLIETIFKR